ncbi:MAG TPA: hypothetical protein VFF53_08650 [Geobacteraceae bacterium]|nr:hypothetical protein [Geobacteraceae bacterium]
MRTNGKMLLTLTALLGNVPAAYAASTNTIYTSGWLVLAFFGFCAAVIAVQLIPAIIMLAGMLKALLTGKEKATVRQVK